jgi:N-methylhydantoinase A
LQGVADEINQAWRDLEKEAFIQMKAEGINPETITFRYAVSARYMGQIESFNTALSSGQMNGPADVQNLILAYEDMYTKVYPEGAKFGAAGYSLTDIHLEAIADKPQPQLVKHKLAFEEPDQDAFVETRKVYHKDKWVEFKVWEMAKLLPGNIVGGPSIIRDPMTTVVIPPGKKMRLDEYLILHYS